jgi:outer membrane protein TolC
MRDARSKVVANLAMGAAAAVLLGVSPAGAQVPGAASATTDPRAAAPTQAPRPSSEEAAPRPASAQKLSFEEAMQRAMARNPTIEVAVEELRRADALVRQARATWFPTLNANGTYTRIDADRVLSGRVIQGVDSLNANLTLTVPLIAPRQWMATNRAKESRELTRMTLTDTRRQLALSAGRAYLTVIGQRRVLESSEHARDTARAHEEFAKARLLGGVGNRLDAVRAARERASAEAKVENQTIALTRAQEALGVLVGESGAVDAHDTALGAPPSLAVALGEAESKRSDVAVSKERVEYARRTVRDSYADYLPVLSGVFQPFYQNPATLTLPTTGWQAQLLLTLPLYDGGLRYGLKQERDVLHEQAKSRLDAALRQARSEVRIAFEAVQRADEGLSRAREASKLAQEGLELAQLAYRAGATSNLEVIDAERSARDAETDAAVAEDTARQARLDLLAAAGRFP